MQELKVWLHELPEVNYNNRLNIIALVDLSRFTVSEELWNRIKKEVAEYTIPTEFKTTPLGSIERYNEWKGNYGRLASKYSWKD